MRPALRSAHGNSLGRGDVVAYRMLWVRIRTGMALGKLKGGDKERILKVGVALD